MQRTKSVSLRNKDSKQRQSITKTETEHNYESSVEQKNAGHSSNSLQAHHHAVVALLIEPMNDDLCKSSLVSLQSVVTVV